MATYYSQASDLWSTLANWDTVAGGGGSNPASVAAMDDQTFIMQTAHVITQDVDMSGFANGIAGLTITGGVNPATLVCKYDADGTYYLKIKTDTTINGTLSTNRGRILANSDGVWSNTGTLPYGRKFIIDLAGTAQLNAAAIDLQLYDAEPTNTFVRTYKNIYTVSSINTTTDVITMTAPHGWSATTPVCITSSGTYPGGLAQDIVYYVVSPSGADLKLSLTSGGSAIDITSAGSGTIRIYDGHSSTSTAVMNVLTDLTADEQWVATAAVVLVDCNAPADYDQQRTTISSLDASTVTLGENVNSAQYPGARIYLIQRNIAIRNNGTSSSQPIVTFSGGTGTGSVLRCEIRNTAGTGTTFYGYGVYAGTGHTISGTVSGNTYGVAYGTGHTISGTVSGNSSGVYAGTGHTISGTVSGNTYDFRFTITDGSAIQGLQCTVLSSAVLTIPPSFYNRNGTVTSPFEGVFCEGYNRVNGASYAFMASGDVIRNTATVRTGGASSSIEVVPLSLCSLTAPIRIFEWTEFDVAASAQTRSVYVKGEGWTGFPTAAQLYFEAEYISNATTLVKTVIASVQVLTDNTTWTKLSVTFTPAAAGIVRYRAWLKIYEAACKVYVDNALNNS